MVLPNSARRSGGIISRWASISSASCCWRRRRWRKAEIRRISLPISGGPQDRLNGGGGFFVLGNLTLQLLEPAAGQGVEADAAAGFRDTGFGSDPAFQKHTLQR